MGWKENGDDEVDDEREGAGWLTNWKLFQYMRRWHEIQLPQPHPTHPNQTNSSSFQLIPIAIPIDNNSISSRIAKIYCSNGRRMNDMAFANSGKEEGKKLFFL